MHIQSRGALIGQLIYQIFLILGDLWSENLIHRSTSTKSTTGLLCSPVRVLTCPPGHVCTFSVNKSPHYCQLSDFLSMFSSISDKKRVLAKIWIGRSEFLKIGAPLIQMQVPFPKHSSYSYLVNIKMWRKYFLNTEHRWLLNFPGGRDKRGGPILTFPARSNHDRIKQEDLRRLVTYLSTVPR